ncbi:unnamed protein product [Owenia fusiformis]|uniref:Uncharacterized protein n=1 Tax=Owenia fusiformis TaxID=6347 RepID=A0A8J1U6S6_OWEFU|nr:unnamed protein product [Owenia fusiformis]
MIFLFIRYKVPHQRKVNIEVVEVAVKEITSKKYSMKKAAEIHGLSKTTLSRYFHMFLKTGKVERPNGHFICGFCSKDCGTLSALQNHSILHQRDLYICPHPGCGKEFVFKAKLNRHFKCHLPASFLCENCGNYFKTKAILERHITTSHGAFERQFCCKICSKGFATERYLQQHMLSHSDTTHQCEKCGKEFKRKFKLNQHVKLCHIYV